MKWVNMVLKILVTDFVGGLAFTSDLVTNILKLSPTLGYSQQGVTNMVVQNVNKALDHQIRTEPHDWNEPYFCLIVIGQNFTKATWQNLIGCGF